MTHWAAVRNRAVLGQNGQDQHASSHADHGPGCDVLARSSERCNGTCDNTDVAEVFDKADKLDFPTVQPYMYDSPIMGMPPSGVRKQLAMAADMAGVTTGGR